jgi:mono/diheme cytochrome c family protein
MILPSEVITPGFGSVLVEFKNGASLTGNLLGETAEHLDLDVTGKSLRVMRADTQAVTAPTSPMPPMGELLNPGELRDVIAWLATLTEGAEEAPVREEPELLDSASLLTAAAAEASPAAEKVALDPAVMKTGKQQFIVCGACHGQNGEGTGAGPPLAGSEWVTGPEENLIRIQLRGLQGPIKVKGKEYQMSGGMAAMAHQTDAQIAAVLTYVRNSFGNTAPAVTAAAVAAHRSEVGKPQLMASELLPPDAIASSAASPAEAAADSSAQTYDELAPSGGIGKWILAGAAVLLVAALTRVLRP